MSPRRRTLAEEMGRPPEKIKWDAVWDFVSTLPDLEQKLVRHIYNPDGSPSNLTYREVADMLDLNVSAVPRRLWKVVRRLRHPQQSRKIQILDRDEILERRVMRLENEIKTMAAELKRLQEA